MFNPQANSFVPRGAASGPRGSVPAPNAWQQPPQQLHQQQQHPHQQHLPNDVRIRVMSPPGQPLPAGGYYAPGQHAYVQQQQHQQQPLYNPQAQVFHPQQQQQQFMVRPPQGVPPPIRYPSGVPNPASAPFTPRSQQLQQQQQIHLPAVGGVAYASPAPSAPAGTRYTKKPRSNALSIINPETGAVVNGDVKEDVKKEVAADSAKEDVESSGASKREEVSSHLGMEI